MFGFLILLSKGMKPVHLDIVVDLMIGLNLVLVVGYSHN